MQIYIIYTHYIHMTTKSLLDIKRRFRQFNTQTMVIFLREQSKHFTMLLLAAICLAIPHFTNKRINEKIDTWKMIWKSTMKFSLNRHNYYNIKQTHKYVEMQEARYSQNKNVH